mgnify:CR=1 FL=1
MMALLTYGKDDPGWSHNSKIDDVQNFGGPAGSYSADILFMVLGYFAYIFQIVAVFVDWVFMYALLGV